MRKLMILIPALVLGPVGCERLSATVVAVGMLTRSPNVSEAIPDATLKAALSTTLSTLPAQNAVGASLGLGEKDSATSTTEPTPITGAVVNLKWGGTSSVKLCEIQDAGGKGTYEATNVTGDACVSQNLAYAPGTEYTFNIERPSATHTIKVTPPTAINPANVSFSPVLTAHTFDGTPAIVLDSHPKNAALTVDWSQDPDANDRNAFATMVRLNYSGAGTNAQALVQGTWTADPYNPIYDNSPTSPGQMVSLILDSPETSVTIPATVFDQTGLYFLILTTAELSTDVSSNLALGSGALAGLGTVFAMWVQ